MREEVQAHIISHIADLLDKIRTTKSGRTENDIIYKHLKILIRWHAQVDPYGKDSYDYKKSDAIQIIKTFGATSKLLQLVNDVITCAKSNDSSTLFKILSAEYKVATCENSIPDVSNYLRSRKKLGKKEINHLIAPLVFYEHMTPSDVVVKEIMRTKVSKIRKDYYVLLIKKEQQLKLDAKGSKYKSAGSAAERLKYINDTKATKKDIETFIKKIDTL